MLYLFPPPSMYSSHQIFLVCQLPRVVLNVQVRVAAAAELPDVQPTNLAHLAGKLEGWRDTVA